MLHRCKAVNTVLLFMTVRLVLVATSHLALAENTSVSEPGSREAHFTIDFSGYAGGSVEKWLSMRGFTFQKDAKNRRLLALSIVNHSLELIANGPMSGFILNDSVNLSNAGRIRIEWGVTRYPEEASYEKRVNNEALMLYVFFGKEKMPSGHMLIPDSPYFIGLFLCQDEKINFPYKGRYFHAGGRFVCLGKPPPGEKVVSEFDLDRAFKNYFGKHQTPGITGIGFGVDTSKAGGGGKGAAFIKSIEFLDEPKHGNVGNERDPVLPRFTTYLDPRTEAAGFTSRWWIDHIPVLYGAQAVMAQWAATFKDFPPIQKPNTFTIDDALRMMHETIGGAH